MLRLAIIGTNWITNKFVEAALETNLFQLCGVYSRSLESAKNFAAPFKTQNEINYYDDLKALATATDIDAVYIASPNSLHCEQSCLMMEHGKHVICEKPLSSNAAEAHKMYQTARNNSVVLFEAFKTEYLPNFIALKNQVAEAGKLHQVYLSYCQYSSRYQKYLNGENPNTFNPAFSNGSIMDIGYYSVAAAVSLFGKPEQVQASARLLESGVDACGSVLLTYADFVVTINHSKVSDGMIPSEIQGEDGCILIDHFSECAGFTVRKRNGEEKVIQLPTSENSMSYEAEAFAAQIQNGTMNEDYVQRSIAVAETITEIRRQTGVVFPADQK